MSCSFLFSSTIYKSGNYVIDETHHLMWQDTKENTIMLGSQEEAINYCKELTLGGYSNWELPTKKEYKYIVDKTRTDEIMLHKAFRYIKQEGYWTQSRTWRNFGRYGYYIFIKSGTLYYENRTYPKFFRCVRSIQ
jgi:hypothetical protein